MISITRIKELAQKYQTTELNVKREYFQHLFLSYFYQQASTDSIFFKGGTALRFLFNSPRFSEDLDFSATIKKISVIEQTLIQTLVQIEKEGIIPAILEAKTTSGGYLSNISFQGYEQPVEIQLQISLRESSSRGELLTIVNDFVPAYTVVGLTQIKLISEKIKALLSRKKPRDFYDLYFILRANLLTSTQKSILSKVLQTLHTVNINFESELKLFLPKSHCPIIKNFKATLEQEIRRFM